MRPRGQTHLHQKQTKETGKILTKGYKLSVISSGVVIYSMVATVNNSALNTWHLLKGHGVSIVPKDDFCEVMNVLISLIVLIILLCLHMSNHH
jgi:hypothetical protein